MRSEELNSDAIYCTDKKGVEHAKGLRFEMYCKAMSMILLIYKFGLRLRASVTKWLYVRAVSVRIQSQIRLSTHRVNIFSLSNLALSTHSSQFGLKNVSYPALC